MTIADSGARGRPLGRDNDLISRQAGHTYLIGDVTEANAQLLIPRLLAMGHDRRLRGAEHPLHLFISSGGGDITVGIAVIETMLRVQREYAVPIHTHVLGYAYSMAAFIHQAGSHRSMGRYSLLMFHAPRYVRSGSEMEIRDHGIISERQQTRLAHLLHARTDFESIGYWLDMINQPGRSRYMDPALAKDMNLIDSVDEEPAL